MQDILLLQKLGRGILGFDALTKTGNKSLDMQQNVQITGGKDLKVLHMR